MLATYKATLQGDRLQWQDHDLLPAFQSKPLDVLVTVLKDSADATASQDKGKRMAAALRALAARNALAKVADPAQWERETRQDRPLPGREP